VDPYHNAETIRGLFPDGAEAFKGALGEEFAVTLDREGVYLVMCRSHYAVGMVALVVVGAMPDRPTLEKAVAGPHPARAKAAFAAILDSLPGR
jgi:pseudoazurin